MRRSLPHLRSFGRSGAAIVVPVLAAVIILSLSNNAFALPGLGNILPGATRKEVVALVGEPKERLERETKREQVWVYPTGTVVFVGGRARSVYIDGSNQDHFSPEYRRKVEMAKPVQTKSDSSPVEDILTEILKEVPSEAPDAPGAGIPSDMKPVEINKQ